MDITYRKATFDDAQAIAVMAVKMWTSHTVNELAQGFADAIRNPDSAVFILTDDDKAVGVARLL